MEDKMKMQDFIKENRKTLDEEIAWLYGSNDFQHNDETRKQWILNDESLYLWAKSEGVKI